MSLVNAVVRILTKNEYFDIVKRCQPRPGVHVVFRWENLCITSPFGKEAFEREEVRFCELFVQNSEPRFIHGLDFKIEKLTILW